jgi:hypothetical protein
MPKQEYPKWVYGPDQQSQLVQDPDAQAALGPDWYEEPYDKHGKPPAPKPAADPDAIWPGDLPPSSHGIVVPKQEYPKWVYGPDEKAQLIQNDAQFDALGDGWFESPGEAKAGKANEPPSTAPTAPTVVTASTAEQPSKPPAAPPASTPFNINALNVTEASLYIDTLTDLEQLAGLAVAEEGGKNRSTVKNAVGARIATLISTPAGK